MITSQWLNENHLVVVMESNLGSLITYFDLIKQLLRKWFLKKLLRKRLHLILTHILLTLNHFLQCFSRGSIDNNLAK